MSPVAIRYGLLVLLLSLMVYAGCRRHPGPATIEAPAEPEGNQSEAPKPPEIRYPRRLLFININNYITLPPLITTSSGQDKLIASKMAGELKVPHEGANPQFFVASQLVGDSKVLRKEEVLGTLDRFLQTSQTSDHIVIYFGGHALELGGKAYLAPAEGTLVDPKTLIPLADFYAKLKTCKATQKVVIWDVCRWNPANRDSRVSDPMSRALYNALVAAPAGIEVVTTCEPGENALELTSLPAGASASNSQGSLFLESVRSFAEKKRIEIVKPPPGDPIPVSDWVASVSQRVQEVATGAGVGLKQTVRYHPGRLSSAQEPDPIAAQPVATRSVPAEALAIEEEFRVPPFGPRQAPLVLDSYPFRDDVLASYKSDVSLAEIRKNPKKYPFRIATLSAFDALRKVWVFKDKGGLKRREFIPAPITEPFKKEIKKEQEPWSIGIAQLEETSRELESVGALRKGQPRRWQAHYDFVCAVVKSRLAFMNEYDKLMGDVETDSLPALDKAKGQNAYRLTAASKMKSKKDVQQLASDAADGFAAVIATYPETPWAIQAKFEKSHLLGLVWEPTARGK